MMLNLSKMLSNLRVEKYFFSKKSNIGRTFKNLVKSKLESLFWVVKIL